MGRDGLQVEEGFEGLEACDLGWVGGREAMSGTRGGRGVGWLPERVVVSCQGEYLVVLVGRVLG